MLNFKLNEWRWKFESPDRSRLLKKVKNWRKKLVRVAGIGHTQRRKSRDPFEGWLLKRLAIKIRKILVRVAGIEQKLSSTTEGRLRKTTKNLQKILVRFPEC